MSVKRILAITLSAFVIIGFVYLGVSDAVKTKDKVEFQKVEIKSKQSDLQEMNLKYNNLNKELTEVNDKKETDSQEIERLRKEKEALDKQKQDLEKQLQSKIEQKSKLAKASSNAINTATGTKTASATSPDALESVIIQAANKYGVSSQMMLRMALCESTMGKNMRNSTPVIVRGVNYGHAEGVYQFIPSTWQRMSSQAGFKGASVYDTYANVNTAAWAFSSGHKGEWECQ